MAFGTFRKTQYPPRQWALVGYATDGKSTFSGNLRLPLGVIDTDNRFSEIITSLGIPDGQAFPISDDRDVHIEPAKAAAVLKANKGAKIGTMIVDSLTGIIQPKVIKAMAGDRANPAKGAGMIEKATAMRTLADALQNFGTDYVLIWHTEARKDQAGAATIHQTLPPTERDALYRALNMELHTVVERDEKGKAKRYGIYVAWARQGKDDFTLWDEPGNKFRGMPERIEAEVYAGGVDVSAHAAPGSPKASPVSKPVSAAPTATNPEPVTPPVSTAKTESSTTPFPTAPNFANKKEAIDWAVREGYCAAYEEAAKEYDGVRPVGANSKEAVFTNWMKHCQARGKLAAVPVGGDSSTDY